MKKILFVLLLSLFNVQAHAVAKYWLGTTSTAWSATANWSLTSGGTSGAAIPVNTDTVIFDGGGNNP